MTVDECLDELRVGILRDSSNLKSGPPDRFWTDDRLVSYIDDAHKRFARLALCIHDSTTPKVCEVPLTPGTAVYTLDKSILMVLSAQHQDDNHEMTRINHQQSSSIVNTFTEDYAFDLTGIVSGKPYQFSTDEGLDPTRNHAIQFKVFGTPDTTQTSKIINLRTIRKPLKKLTLNDQGGACELEIPEEYHLDCMEWAAFRALRNWDIDGENRPKAEQHKARFEEAVSECKRDIMRKLYRPHHWRFGGGGFTYIKN